MVKVPGFPDVALNDVWRSKIAFDEDYSTRTVGLVTPAMLANKEVLKTLTIDEKIEFWRRVMSYAQDRNISVHVVTWNVYTYGVEGKYGITDALDNPKTRDYFRASVREMFRTYPLLAGMGLTVGENMGEVSFQTKEDWALATYGQGVLDAARAEPQRQFRLIHRQHEAGAADIAAKFAPVIAQPNVEFVFSFKYAQAHVLSSTKQTFHRDFVPSLGNLRTLWTLRNDDALMFRWAAPDFVREFVRNIPDEKSRGFYYGSDMWVWGREFLARRDPPRDSSKSTNTGCRSCCGAGWATTRPSTTPYRGAGRAAFSGRDRNELLAAWQDASMIYPLVTGFHWGALDFQWYIEGCRSRPGSREDREWISQRGDVHRPAGSSGYGQHHHSGLRRRHRQRRIEARHDAAAGRRKIDERADAALAALTTSVAGRPAQKDTEYVGHPRRHPRDGAARQVLRGENSRRDGAGAVSPARNCRRIRPNAVTQLTSAAGFWKEYTRRTGARYRNPMWTNRVGIVDWRELDAEVDNDIAIARR